MSSFNELVDKCRSENSDRIISNAAWDHALYLFKNLLEVAAEKKESVKISTGNFNEEFYMALSEQFDKCMDSEVEIEVLVLSAQSEEKITENVLVNKLRGYAHGRVLSNQSAKETDGAHMLLVGESRFRLETNHEQTKAFASFNNPEFCKDLLSLYGDIKSRLMTTQAAA